MMNSNDPQADLFLSFALAHLGMIAQAARGQYKPDPGEIEEREAWLVGYLRTGQGLVTEENRAIAEAVNKAVNQERTSEELALVG